MRTRSLLAVLALPMLLLPEANGAPPAVESGYPWTIVCADCPHSFVEGSASDRSLQFDAAGRLHVAYGGGQLYYAEVSDDGWQVEIADATVRVGNGAALALDASGQPHISYFNQLAGDLRYAFRDVAGWHIVTVDSEGSSGRYTAIALDSQGHAHISYLNEDTHEVRYAYQDGEGWQIERVDNGFARMTSLALDALGRPHIAYWAGAPDYDLRHATRDTQGWQVETVDDQSDIGSAPSIAVDSQGGIHIAYQEGYFEDLRYAVNHGAGWQLETVDSEGYTGYSASLTLDSSGRPHISYVRKDYRQDWGEVRYAKLGDAGWQREIANLGSDRMGFTSLALDGIGKPCIAHTDAQASRGSGSLLVACRQFPGDDSGAQPAAWLVEVVDQEEIIGQESSLAIDALGRPHLAYTGRGLTYAWSAGLPEMIAGQTVTPAWQRESVDSRGKSPSLAIDAAGVPHLAYIDSADNSLRYARRGALGWQIETVAADVRALSLAVDSSNRPLIGYANEDGVFYAHRGQEGWQSQPVDPRGGSQVSLALRVGDEPCMAYVNEFGDLKYAYQAESVWYSQIVEVAEEAFTGPWLAIDDQGNPHISFSQRYEYENVEFVGVRHAYRTAAGWSVEEVHANTDFGSRTALAFDRRGTPYIASDDVDRVWLATYEAAGWQVEEVAAAYSMLFSGLALDPWGRPAIVFYDAYGSNGLILAARGPALSRMWLPLVRR